MYPAFTATELTIEPYPPRVPLRSAPLQSFAMHLESPIQGLTFRTTEWNTIILDGIHFDFVKRIIKQFIIILNNIESKMELNSQLKPNQ